MQLIPRLLGSALLGLAALGAHATSAPTPWSSLVVFGDSLSDGGNNSLLSFVGNNPAQVVTGNTYIPTQTYAAAPGMLGTYSNGPVWATQFAAQFGLNALPSLAGGTNFAFGGATTRRALTYSTPLRIISNASLSVRLGCHSLSNMDSTK